MEKYKVKSNIKHNGDNYVAGDSIELSEEVAKTLMDAGALVNSDEKEVTEKLTSIKEANRRVLEERENEEKKRNKKAQKASDKKKAEKAKRLAKEKKEADAKAEAEKKGIGKNKEVEAETKNDDESGDNL